MVMIDVQQAYECAFEEFSRQARAVQLLTSQPNVDRSKLDAALLELERARVVYDRSRDALAESLLPAPLRDQFLRLIEDSPEVHEDRIRGVAEMLWEAAGRPEGTADDDWRRASEIMRRAAAAAA